MRAFIDIISNLIEGTYHLSKFTSVRVAEWWKFFSKWPPNVFALTSSVLAETGAYIYTVSPPQGMAFPSKEYSDGWSRQHLDNEARSWINRTENTDNTESPSELFVKSSNAICAWIQQDFEYRRKPAQNRSLRVLLQALDAANGDRRDHAYSFINAIMYLHAISDLCMEAIGIPEPHPKRWDLKRILFTMRCNLRLALKNNNLSETNIQVVPKMRTPRPGITVRSMSLYAAIEDSEFNVLWHAAPEVSSRSNEGLNLLLIPWPDEVDRGWIKAEQPTLTMSSASKSGIGFFSYDPPTRVSQLVERIDGLLRQLDHRGVEVDGIVFPELALNKEELDAVMNTISLRSSATPSFILAGLRRPAEEHNSLAQNLASFSLRIDKKWRQWEQHKHHRWRLDAGQLESYQLAAKLDSNRSWWENTEIKNREVHFIAVNEWLTMCHLICEDLARLDPVADIVRSVGPNLIIALLFDGPQIPQRWPARFANVLADDPGTSVLTLTALGMVKLSRPRGPDSDSKRSDAVASWTDAISGTRALSLSEGAKGILLTLGVEWKEEWTADGRNDAGYASTIRYVAHESIVPIKNEPLTSIQQDPDALKANLQPSSSTWDLQSKECIEEVRYSASLYLAAALISAFQNHKLDDKGSRDTSETKKALLTLLNRAGDILRTEFRSDTNCTSWLKTLNQGSPNSLVDKIYDICSRAESSPKALVSTVANALFQSHSQPQRRAVRHRRAIRQPAKRRMRSS